MPPSSIYDLRNPATLTILGAIFVSAIGGAMSFRALQSGQEQNGSALAQVIEGQKAEAAARKELELTVGRHTYEISSLNDWRKEVSAPSRTHSANPRTAGVTQ